MSTDQHVPDVTLNNGVRMPIFGFGVSLDAGRSLFFDHQDPQMVTQLGTWRVPA